MADNYLEKKFEEHYSQPSRQRITHIKTKIRNVFVTGGANGIGRAIVKQLRMAGNNVAFCDIDDLHGEELASTTGTVFLHVDVRNSSQLEAAMDSIAEKWGHIDILVNSAAISSFCDLTETTINDFDNVLNINMRSVFVTARKYALMCKNNSCSYGRIINISSTYSTRSLSGSEAYSASAGAIISLTRALAMSMAQYGITVNCISHGYVDATDEKNVIRQAETMARIVRFLCDDNNDFVNGENIVCDGGSLCQMKC